MEEGMPPLPDRPLLLEPRDFLGLDYPSLYMCKPKRGMKRDESKETYKLPHRLIEKKRRDRINECIAQLKDLLPEHLKLTTLGHLEKAVVLELTLKHLKALTALTEQQHQKIIALQNGERRSPSKSPSLPPACDPREAFHSGFQSCAKEVLHFLALRGCDGENGTATTNGSWASTRELLLGHLHSLCARFLPGPPSSSFPGNSLPLDQQPHCVPVIQRTQAAAAAAAAAAQSLSETDTDTDSGYGGEGEGAQGGKEEKAITIKQEEEEEEEEEEEGAPAKKRRKGLLDCAAPSLWRPDPTLLGSWVALGAAPGSGPGSGSGPSLGHQPPPFCLPFYFISPSYLQPFLDKSHLERYLYPAAAAAAASPFPMLYPGIIPAQAAAAAAFPRLSSSSVLLSPDGAAPPPPPLTKADLLPPQEEPSQEEKHSGETRQQGIAREKKH